MYVYTVFTIFDQQFFHVTCIDTKLEILLLRWCYTELGHSSIANHHTYIAYHMQHLMF